MFANDSFEYNEVQASADTKSGDDRADWIASSAVSQNDARGPGVRPMPEMDRDELQLMHSYSVTKGAESLNASPRVAPDELPCSS